MHEFVPKPKINRLPLPATHAQTYDAYMSDNYIIWRSMWVFAVLAVLILIFMGYQYSIGSSQTAIIPADDARLMALINAEGDSVQRNNSSVYFNDSGEVIVGQVVKIAPEPEKKIASRSEDMVSSKPAGHDLLAILSKH
jgi:hypothetical protein